MQGRQNDTGAIGQKGRHGQKLYFQSGTRPYRAVHRHVLPHGSCDGLRSGTGEKGMKVYIYVNKMIIFAI